MQERVLKRSRFLWIGVVILMIIYALSLFFSAGPRPGDSDHSVGKIAVIGAAGYIGSSLVHFMQTEHAMAVDGFDRSPKSFRVRHMASHDIPQELLREFEIVIYLGGITGRKVCDARYLPTSLINALRKQISSV
jgi:hypothetical protein